MATKDPCHESHSFELLNITDNRCKYFNPRYSKVNSKLCDWRCDVQFRVGYANFRAHRDVLADASDYFSAMFNHDMLEKNKTVINIHEIGPKGFQCLLDYIYHGYLNIDSHVIDDILETARYFHVPWLVSVSCDYLSRRLSCENFVAVMQLADIFCLNELYAKLFEFLSTNLVAISQKSDFMYNATFEFLRDYLDADIFMENSEAFLLKVLFDWLEADPDSRYEYSRDLLCKIRFGLLTMEEIDNIPGYVLKHREIVTKIEKARCYIRRVNTQCLHDDDLYRERGATDTIVALSACEFSNGTMVIYKDPKSCHSCFEEIKSSGLDTELEFTSQAVLGNFLFVAGGYESDYVSSDRLFRYDPRYRDWFELSPMTYGRVQFTMTGSRSRLFVLGGVNHIFQDDRDNEFMLTSCESYDPTTNSWSNLPSLIQGCYGLASAFHKDTIYISGGITSEPNDPVPTNYAYSHRITTDEWSPIPSMLYCRYNHSMACIKDDIYPIGGKTSLLVGELSDCLAIESYNTTTQQWTHVSSIPSELGPVCQDVGVFGSYIAFLAGPPNARVLYIFDTDKRVVTEEQYCGAGFAKVSVLPVAFPRFQ